MNTSFITKPIEEVIPIVIVSVLKRMCTQKKPIKFPFFVREKKKNREIRIERRIERRREQMITKYWVNNCCYLYQSNYGKLEV